MGVPFAKITSVTDACYVIAQTKASNITIKVFNINSEVTHYFRIFVRENVDGSAEVFNKTFTRSGDHAYTFTISGLSANTDYIMNFGEAEDDTGYGTEWWGTTKFYTATTTAPTINTPTIDGKDVELPWKNRTGKSAGYLIVVNDYIKDYGNVSSSTTTHYSNLTFDYYDRTYVAYVYTIASDGRASYDSISFTTGPLVITPTPTINSIDTSRGISDVRIYWDVDEHVSGTTYTIYVKQSGGSWVAKTTLTSVPSSGYTSTNVNKSNTLYYVYIQANLNGDTVDSNTESFRVTLTVPSAWTWTTAELNAFNNKRTMFYNHKNSLE